MSTIIPLKDKALPERCFVFKHSTACGISTRAAKEVEALQTDLPVYWVNVIEQRELSDWIAQTYEVRHESPQLILLTGASPPKVWNHSQVNRDLIMAALTVLTDPQ